MICNVTPPVLKPFYARPTRDAFFKPRDYSIENQTLADDGDEGEYDEDLLDDEEDCGYSEDYDMYCGDYCPPITAYAGGRGFLSNSSTYIPPHTYSANSMPATTDRFFATVPWYPPMSGGYFGDSLEGWDEMRSFASRFLNDDEVLDRRYWSRIRLFYSRHKHCMTKLCLYGPKCGRFDCQFVHVLDPGQCFLALIWNRFFHDLSDSDRDAFVAALDDEVKPLCRFQWSCIDSDCLRFHLPPPEDPSKAIQVLRDFILKIRPAEPPLSSLLHRNEPQ